MLIYGIQGEFNLLDLKILANPHYPSSPKTSSEELRKWRMVEHLTAKQLAERLGVYP